jgi:hypothetical protein
MEMDGSRSARRDLRPGPVSYPSASSRSHSPYSQPGSSSDVPLLTSHNNDASAPEAVLSLGGSRAVGTESNPQNPGSSPLGLSDLDFNTHLDRSAECRFQCPRTTSGASGFLATHPQVVFNTLPDDLISWHCRRNCGALVRSGNQWTVLLIQ